jgi:hypothetical protein
MATPRLSLVLVVAPLLVSCNTRFHLAGDVDTGSVGGTLGSDAGATGGGAVGYGGRGAGTGGGPAGTSGVAPGAGGAAATSGGGAGGTTAPATAAPMPLRISPREAVTRLARVLWENLPDEMLVALADSGTVTTDEDVRRVALNMLTDSRSRTGVAHFYRWWLNLDALAATAKDPVVFPEYSTALGTSMASETEAFALNVTFDGDGRYPTLMRGSYSFLNGALASLYGIPDVTGVDLRKVDLDPTQRAGILTQGAFLTQTSSSHSWTSPTRRGLFVANRILCRGVPPPPPDGSSELVVGPTGPVTNRQRLEAAIASPACAGCHVLMDPLGFAYESFDSIGRVRLMDSGLAIDASGAINLSGVDYTWNNAIELAQILATSQDAHDCLGRQWLQYVLARNLTPADDTSVAAIGRLFTASGLDLRTAIAAAVSSPSFLDPAGGPPCTAGLPQTCNDDPKISSLRGTCTPAGKCVCTGTTPLNPDTGRCL